jgi:hypothetical protein
MTNRRSTILCAVVAAALSSPAGAQAAALTADKPCYGGGDTLVLTGRGFTANGTAALGVNTSGFNRFLGDRRANAAGVLQYTSTVPFVTLTPRRTDTFTAVDRANPANRAQVPVMLSRIRVGIAPRSGRPGRRQRIRATGFTTGRRLYAHVRRGGRGRNIRVGRLRGACKSLNVRRRLFRRARPGTYRVQFDVARRYKRTRRQRMVFRVRVFRTFRPAAARATTAGERWERVG